MEDFFRLEDRLPRAPPPAPDPAAPSAAPAAVPARLRHPHARLPASCCLRGSARHPPTAHDHGRLRRSRCTARRSTRAPPPCPRLRECAREPPGLSSPLPGPAHPLGPIPRRPPPGSPAHSPRKARPGPAPRKEVPPASPCAADCAAFPLRCRRAWVGSWSTAVSAAPSSPPSGKPAPPGSASPQTPLCSHSPAGLPFPAM